MSKLNFFSSFFLIFVFNLSFDLFSQNEQEIYYLENIDDQIRFTKLLKQFRCPKCTSSSLAGSNAPIAKDLKSEIHRLVREGKTEEEISKFLETRYGEYVLFKTPFKRSTFILWLGPFILFLLVISLIIAWKLRTNPK